MRFEGDRRSRPDQGSTAFINTCYAVIKEVKTDGDRRVSPAYIDGKIGDCKVKLMIDTGASLSLIQTKLLEQLLRNTTRQYNLRKWDRGELRIASGKPLKVRGLVDVCVDVGPVTLGITMAVVDELSKSIIIGVDVLTRLHAHIDLREGRLTIAGQYNVPLDLQAFDANMVEEDEDVEEEEIPMYEPECFKVVAARDFEIPGRSIIVAESELPEEQRKHLGRKGCAVISDHITDEDDWTQPLFTANTLVDLKEDKFPTQILNLSSKSITVKAGQVVGLIEVVNECDVEEVPQTQPTPVAIPDNVPDPDINLDQTPLTEDQKTQVRRLLHEYRDCFADKLIEPGKLVGFEATIPLEPGTQPLYTKDYRRPPKEHQQLKEDTREMLQQKVIEPSDGPWSSPPVYVPKKTGERRFCVNYRRLNSKTIADVYPLPRIDDMFDALHRARLFSLLDATTGYWQIPIKKEERPKTAFMTQDGLFQFTVVPFGLKRAPATWQRAMNAVFAGLLWKKCLIYMDDLLIYSHTFAEHLENLHECLRRARERNLKFKPKKCQLFMTKLDFLGHEVSSEGIHTSSKKVAAIAKLRNPPPPS